MTPPLIIGALVGAIFALSLGEWGQVFGVGVVLVGFLAVGRTKAKDATIATWRGEAEAHEARAQRLQEELEGAQERANTEHEQRRACERRISHLEGEIKTLERYTAQEALNTVADELAETRTAVVTAIEGSKELSMRNLEVLSKIDKHLGGVGTFDDPLPFSGHDRPVRPSE